MPSRRPTTYSIASEPVDFTRSLTGMTQNCQTVPAGRWRAEKQNLNLSPKDSREYVPAIRTGTEALHRTRRGVSYRGQADTAISGFALYHVWTSSIPQTWFSAGSTATSEADAISTNRRILSHPRRRHRQRPLKRQGDARSVLGHRALSSSFAHLQLS